LNIIFFYPNFAKIFRDVFFMNIIDTKKWFLTIICSIYVLYPVFGQVSATGKALHEKTKKPVEYAYIMVNDGELWATTDAKGNFMIRNIPKGEIDLTVQCLGYVRKTFRLNIRRDTADLILYMQEDNLALDEVVITAKSRTDGAVGSYTVDRAALEHLQVSAINDIMSLMPGGQTNRQLHLATGSSQNIALRSSGATEMGNPSFGTAIEVDGVRLSNNAAFGASTSGTVYGADTRSIASGNIESVELITGIASAEYGDMTNGVVKVNTKKGKSPFSVELATKPNTKQATVNRGFSLGSRAGILNASLEYVKSVSDLASPYTSYRRNSISMIYENTFNKNGKPLALTTGISGNIGGYDSKADPDAFKNTYTKESDNTARIHAKLTWLINSAWITNVEAAGAVTYSDRLKAENTNKSNSSSSSAIHGREEGYFVASRYEENPDAAILLIPPGYWYQLEYTDSKPLNITGNLKVKQIRKFGKVNSSLMIGVDAGSSANKGRGKYYADMRYAPDWREYRYSERPAMNTLAMYAEEKVNIPLAASFLQLTAGLRSDFAFIKGSEYGDVGSLSPRFNAKYSLRNSPDRFVKRLNVRAGWGKFVKLPSFSVLYPEPSYRDIIAFAPGAMADGTVFYAYHIMPSKLQYNPNLRWQYSNQFETGFEAKIKGATITLTAYYHKTFDSYKSTTTYKPFSYKFTGQSDLENCPVPSIDRQYSINQTTGVVTVYDKTGQHAPQELTYKNKHTFQSLHSYGNDSPFVKKGIEWIVEFDRIQALQTSVRWDGSWYSYRGTQENIEQYAPVSQQNADGEPYRYVGFYAGGHNSSNGSEIRRLNTNLTVTTHIPALRIVVSLKIESSLYSRTQRLSEYDGKVRGFALDGRDSYAPAADSPEDIYNTNRYVAAYPLYYVSLDDMNTPVPFAEKFEWAKNNDRTLYNELSKLVLTSNTGYFFDAARISAYYSANISVTKEIGSVASLSFNAMNFTNNMQRVRSSDTGIWSTLYGSSYIPNFYYGLSLKIKIN
jgi:hypothetical protein